MGITKQDPVDVLRERYGPRPEVFREKVKAQTRLKRKIRKVLVTSPRTVPQLAQELGQDTRDVLWQLMAMKKYGSVVECGQVEGYKLYCLAEEKS